MFEKNYVSIVMKRKGKEGRIRQKRKRAREMRCKTVSLLFIILKFSIFCTGFGGKSVQFKHVTMRQMEMR